MPDIEVVEKKSFNSEKLLGYFLLVIGIVIIAAAIFMIRQVLTGKTKAPVVFNVVAPSVKLPQDSTNVQLPQGFTLPEGIKINQATPSPTDFKVIPDEVFNGVLNIGMYYLFMMFLASSGAKVADIGVKMIKDIKVQIKEEKIKST